MVTVLDRITNAPRVRHPEKAHRPDQEVLRKPDWIRVKAPTSKGYADTREIVKAHKLVTVCEEAGCPNIGECWDKKHATFMIMGEICTRACAFCNVATGIPTALDHDEPARVADAVKQMGLTHVVITSVDRDDLDDGGAEHFAQVIRAIRAATPGTTIEILTPDFLRKDGALEIVVAAKPDVFNHNLETVPSNYLTVRPGARYFHSIRLLQRVKELDPQIFTKSGIMVGLGRRAERDPAAHGRSALGQCRLHDHRPVSAAVEEAPSGEAFRHAGGVQVLRDDRQDQGFPAGRVEPADAFLASCRRGLCPVARGARGAAREIGVSRSLHAAVRNHQACQPSAATKCSRWSRTSKNTRNSCRFAKALTVRSRKERDGRTVLVADMTVGYKAIRETFTSQVHLKPDENAIDVKYLDGPFRYLSNIWRFDAAADGGTDIHFFIDYEFKSRILGAMMGAMFDRAFRMFTNAFEKRADAIYGKPGVTA